MHFADQGNLLCDIGHVFVDLFQVVFLLAEIVNWGHGDWQFLNRVEEKLFTLRIDFIDVFLNKVSESDLILALSFDQLLSEIAGINFVDGYLLDLFNVFLQGCRNERIQLNKIKKHFVDTFILFRC